MHIPDVLISLPVAASTGALSLAGVAFAFSQKRHAMAGRGAPLLGLSAAFVFAAQMVNFPVMAGTSGHLVGGVLLGALLGPSAAAIAMTCVLVLQALMFADGGILALGANVFNMAILQAVAGTAIYQAVHRLLPGPRGRFTAAMFAGWFGVVLAAAACAGEVVLSGKAQAAVFFPAMLGGHVLIGAGEGLITALVLESIARTNPQLLAASRPPEPARRMAGLVVWGLLIALGIAVFISPFACPWPDGLENAVERWGFRVKSGEAVSISLMPNYRLPAIASPALATAAAGAIGTAAMFLLAWGLGWLMTRRTAPAPVPAPASGLAPNTAEK